MLDRCHGERLLQGHHDLIDLLGEKTPGSQENAHFRRVGLRLQDSAKTFKILGGTINHGLTDNDHRNNCKDSSLRNTTYAQSS